MYVGTFVQSASFESVHKAPLGGNVGLASGLLLTSLRRALVRFLLSKACPRESSSRSSYKCTSTGACSRCKAGFQRSGPGAYSSNSGTGQVQEPFLDGRRSPCRVEVSIATGRAPKCVTVCVFAHQCLQELQCRSARLRPSGSCDLRCCIRLHGSEHCSNMRRSSGSIFTPQNDSRHLPCL